MDFLQLLRFKTSISGAQNLRVGDQVLKKGGDGGPTAKISPVCAASDIFFASTKMVKWLRYAESLLNFFLDWECLLERYLERNQLMLENKALDFFPYLWLGA